MAIALVNSITGGLGVNGGTTGTLVTTGANLLIAHLGSYGAFENPLISNDLGGTWNPLTAISWPASEYVTSRLFWCIPDATGSDFFDITGSAVYVSYSIAAFSGASTSPYSGEESGALAGVGTVVPGLITPPEPNCLCVSGVAVSAPTTSSYSISVSDPAPTVIQTPYSGDPLWEGNGLGWQIQEDPEINFNPTWSWGGDFIAAAGTAAIFLPAGDTPSGSWNYRAQQQ